MTTYKGKNIRVSDETHKIVSEHCGKKLVIGAFTDEAIKEKIEREGIPTLDRQDPKLTEVSILKDGTYGVGVDWPVKKETKA